MPTTVRQGDIYYCHFPSPVKSRPILVLSRTELNAARENVIVALITRTIRNIPTEIPVGKEEGLPKQGVASLGDIYTVSKALLSEKKGELSETKLRHMQEGLKLLFALPETVS